MSTENAVSRVTFTRIFPLRFARNVAKPTRFNRVYSYSYSYTRNYPPGCGPNVPKTMHIGPRSAPGLGPCPVSRPVFKKPLRVKFVGPIVKSEKLLGEFLSRSEGGMLKERVKAVDFMVKGKNVVGETVLKGEGEGMSKERVKVREMLRVFRMRCDELLSKGVKRVDITANKELLREGKIMKQGALMFGPVPGVEVGDKFHYRIELVIVGLHRLFQGGIDSMECGGQRCATCIVACEGHLDKMGDSNVLSYIGEGGTLNRNETGVPSDQLLKGGNLALNNSRLSKMPVRVVRGIRYGSGHAKIVYVYDGLYEVCETVKKRGPQRNMVFEFLMARIPGQPVVPWREVKRKLV